MSEKQIVRDKLELQCLRSSCTFELWLIPARSLSYVLGHETPPTWFLSCTKEYTSVLVAPCIHASDTSTELNDHLTFYAFLTLSLPDLIINSPYSLPYNSHDVTYTFGNLLLDQK